MTYPPQPPAGGGYYAAPPPPRPQHPQAVLALVLGILSLVLCQVLGPFAWNIGGKAVREIDSSGGRYDGRGLAQAGKICGIVATVLLGLSLLAIFFLIVGSLAFA